MLPAPLRLRLLREDVEKTRAKWLAAHARGDRGMERKHGQDLDRLQYLLAETVRETGGVSEGQAMTQRRAEGARRCFCGARLVERADGAEWCGHGHD